jgi:hypothetical protein
MHYCCIVPEHKLQHRILIVLLAGSLSICSVTASQAAAPAPTEPSPQRTASPPSAPAQDLWAWRPSAELLAQIAGAFAGIGAYSLLLAPQAAGSSGIASLLGNRIMATVMAASGAVAATYAYDRWADSPVDYAYFWHRGGFVVGMAAGVATFGVLGYPVVTNSTWFGWAANRAALMGTGLLGAWGTDQWYAGLLPWSASTVQ